MNPQMTGDGSPTLRTQFSDERSETMHSQAGALTETEYIYGSAMEELRKKSWPANLLVVGLGVGYIEMLASDIFSENHELRILSFESEDSLRNGFLGWLQGHPTEHYETHQKACELLAEKRGSTTDSIKKRLCELYEKKQFLLEGAFDGSFNTNQKYSCILYDAFSGHSQPELWQEDFLDQILKRYAHPECIFSTYAAKSSLTRSLKKNGFEVIPRPGFAGKRESTFAVREFSI